MSEISFIDTTLRDGQQSLWALGMKTDAMLGAAHDMDRIGFESMEFFVSIMIKKYVRELKENPWTWLREGTKLFRRTRLRNHGGLHGSGAMEKLPQSAMKLFAERVVSYGVTMTRTSNCWNDFEELRSEVIELRQIGMDTVVNLIYSVSPRHSDEYYAQKTREAAAINPYRICFKDVGGLLTPERARTLIPAIMQNAGKVAVEYHAHCNNGLAPLCYLEAIKHGVTSLHTAVPPLANGSSQPSILNMAKNLRALGYTPIVDEQAVKPVAEHFTAIAKRDSLAIGKPFA
jgi:oxaloacetate decarboxylase alpha subunit